MGVAWTAAGGPHGAKNYNDIVASSVLVRPATSLRKRIHSTMPSPTWNIGRESRGIRADRFESCAEGQ